jgi:electron transport complex protein RnfB
MWYELLTMSGLGVISSVGLGFAAKKFHVDRDPRIEKIDDVLPHAQCGACGYPGCKPFATAVVAGEAPLTGCTVGGAATSKLVAGVMGVELDNAGAEERLVAKIICKGGCEETTKKFTYDGVYDCTAATLVAGGDKSCSFACIGLGTCVAVCPFPGAIAMDGNMLPEISDDYCTGCGICAIACPKDVIEMWPVSKKVIVACASQDKGSATKKNCTVGCVACDQCVKACPYEAITMEHNLAKIHYDKCINCGLCIPSCPTDTISDFILLRPKAVIYETCTGCLMCKKACPVNAIEGESKQIHIVDKDKCIGCYICADICPVDGALEMVTVERFDQVMAELAPKLKLVSSGK